MAVEKEPFERPATIARKRTWAAWLTAPACAIAFLFPFLQPLMSGASLAVSLAVILVQWLILVAWFLPARGRGQVAVTPDAVTLDGSRLFSRDSIRQAVRHWGAKTGQPSVRVTRRLLAGCDVTFDSDDDARAFLRALSKDGHHVAASFAVAGRASRRRFAVQTTAAIGVGLGFIVLLLARVLERNMLLEGARAVPIVGFGLVLLGFALSFAWRTTMVVGTDGLLVRGPLRRLEFFPYDAIQDIQRDGDDVVLVLRNGQAPRFSLGDGVPDAEARVSALLERIAEARGPRVQGSKDSAAELDSMLARGGREVGVWIHALRGLRSERATYRAPTVSAAQLWRVLEDPTQPAPARAASAVALREALDDDGRTRLRVAADTCASVPLRGVLEAVREDGDEAVERALASIEVGK